MPSDPGGYPPGQWDPIAIVFRVMNRRPLLRSGQHRFECIFLDREGDILFVLTRSLPLILSRADEYHYKITYSYSCPIYLGTEGSQRGIYTGHE